MRCVRNRLTPYVLQPFVSPAANENTALREFKNLFLKPLAIVLSIGAAFILLNPCPPWSLKSVITARTQCVDYL